MDKGQQRTKVAYEDPEIVEGYIQRNSLQPKQASLLFEFAKTIKGRRVLDLGCGPGHDSYLFADLGFEVTGFDYSSEMIRRAKSFRQAEVQPFFITGDMRYLRNYFTENKFDAIWASASLLHIRKEDISQVLATMSQIAKSNCRIYISLKEGSGTRLVKEDKLGKPMQREFTFWTKESFLKEVSPYQWVLDNFMSQEGSLFIGKPTKWLIFFFTLNN
jgi:ubiquinone/menaquinone biosynthesis C-methylase UbiE